MGSTDESVIGKGISHKELVKYQDGSVVSRTIIDRKVGTVTVFAFDKDQGLSEHRTPYDALVFIIDGEADVVISNRSNILKTGEMIVMPRNEPHSVRALTRFKMVLVMIRE
jgi:quercetin dioxygenase-like cupin family protein